jgi:predicted nuclease with TOPRIM domain
MVLGEDGCEVSTNDKPDTVDDEAVQFIIPPGEPLGELNRIQYLQSQLTTAKEEIEKLKAQNSELEDKLYHESRRAPEAEYKLGHEIEKLTRQLEVAKAALYSEEYIKEAFEYLNGTLLIPSIQYGYYMLLSKDNEIVFGLNRQIKALEEIAKIEKGE